MTSTLHWSGHPGVEPQASAMIIQWGNIETVSLVPGTQNMPNKYQRPSLCPDFITVNLGRLRAAFFQAPTSAVFFPQNTLCVVINLQFTHTHTHVDCYSNIGLFKVDSCFKAAGSGKRPSRVLPPTRGLWVRESGPPSVGLIEGRAAICLSQKGDWLPGFGPSSPEIFLKALPASPVGNVSTSDPRLSWKM